MLDSIRFGLTPNVEVKFLTPEEAAKVGASSGYNAVYNIGSGRVRYELLKAGKTPDITVTTKEPQTKQPVTPTTKSQKTPKQKVVEPVEPVVQPVEEKKEEVVEEVNIKTEIQ